MPRKRCLPAAATAGGRLPDPQSEWPADPLPSGWRKYLRDHAFGMRSLDRKRFLAGGGGRSDHLEFTLLPATASHQLSLDSSSISMIMAAPPPVFRGTFARLSRSIASFRGRYVSGLVSAIRIPVNQSQYSCMLRTTGPSRRYCSYFCI